MCIGVDGPNHGGCAQWTWKPFHQHNLSGIEVSFCSTSGQKNSINVEDKKAGFVENYENRTGGMAVQCAVMWRDRTRRNSAKICDNPKKIRSASQSCRKMTSGFSQRKKMLRFFFSWMRKIRENPLLDDPLKNEILQQNFIGKYVKKIRKSDFCTVCGYIVLMYANGAESDF